jgi:hypothetical protein
MTPSMPRRTVSEPVHVPVLVSRMRRLSLIVVTLFWVGLTPLRDELEEAGLVRLW